MFKSVFAKYVTAFMVIVTVSFALLLVIITLIVGRFSGRNTEKMMESTAKIAAVTLAEACEESGNQSLSESIIGAESENLCELVQALLGGKKTLVLVFDEDGKILQTISSESGETIHTPVLGLPALVAASLDERGVYVGPSELISYEERPMAAAKIGATNGEMLGSVVIVFFDLQFGIALEDVTNAIISSACLVFAAVLIAVYFITRRTVTPLREMSIAARSFASGHFDARVRVRGRDEVAELAVAFNQMAESLERAERLRTTFIANVSHDLRTPMTTIAGFIDSIRDGVIPPEEQDYYLGIVSSEVHRLSRLVSSLLDLSRIQAGDRKFVMKSFDICEMARLILISFEKQIDEKRLDVSFECDSDRMLVIADRDAIHQVFYNVCHNAIKFAREGGALRVQIESTKERKICVSVYNEGDGIPTEDQPMIFERFYKSDKSRGLDKTGVGLGLYISKTIMQAHGERIGVHSTPGRDCEFYFTLEPAQQGVLIENEDE